MFKCYVYNVKEYCRHLYFLQETDTVEIRYKMSQTVCAISSQAMIFRLDEWLGRSQGSSFALNNYTCIISKMCYI